ncbi:MAG: hypothetical protein ACRD1Z_16415, partial [Vicinamibacteria bacterium]
VSAARSIDSSITGPVPIQPRRAVEIIERLLATERCFWEAHNGPPLRREEPRPARLIWEADTAGVQRPKLDVEGTSLTVLPVEPPWYVDSRTFGCGPLDAGLPQGVLTALVRAPALTPQAAAAVRQKLAGSEAVLAPTSTQPLPLPREIKVEQTPVTSRPVPHLLLFGASVPRWAREAPDGDSAIPVGRLSFQYGGLRVKAGASGETVPVFDGDTLRMVRRDLDFEDETWEGLDSSGLIPIEDINFPQVAGIEPTDLVPLSGNPIERMLDFVTGDVPKLRAAGWTIEMHESFPCRLVDQSPEWFAEISGGRGDRDDRANDWFGLELGVEIEGHRVNLLPILLKLLRTPGSGVTPDELARVKKGAACLVRLDDGRLLPLPAERVRTIVGTLAELYVVEDLGEEGRLPVSALQSAVIADLEDSMAGAGLHWTGVEALRDLGRRLRDFKGIESIAPPGGLNAILRHYQQDGLNWLQFLREHRLGGILADDMGLG